MRGWVHMYANFLSSDVIFDPYIFVAYRLLCSGQLITVQECRGCGTMAGF